MKVGARRGALQILYSWGRFPTTDPFYSLSKNRAQEKKIRMMVREGATPPRAMVGRGGGGEERGDRCRLCGKVERGGRRPFAF